MKEEEIQEMAAQISSLSLSNDHTKKDLQNLHHRIRELEAEIGKKDEYLGSYLTTQRHAILACLSKLGWDSGI